MNTTYTCVICEAINHSSHFACSCCGAVPARYSWTGRPSNSHAVDVVVAHGAVRAAQHYRARLGLKTVELSYYAEV